MSEKAGDETSDPSFQTYALLLIRPMPVSSTPPLLDHSHTSASTSHGKFQCPFVGLYVCFQKWLPRVKVRCASNINKPHQLYRNCLLTGDLIRRCHYYSTTTWVLPVNLNRLKNYFFNGPLGVMGLKLHLEGCLWDTLHFLWFMTSTQALDGIITPTVTGTAIYHLFILQPCIKYILVLCSWSSRSKRRWTKRRKR